MMQLADYLRVQARANRLANRRLHAAMVPLTRTELHAPRTGFFPSLSATLNHILEVDQYYVGALHGEPDLGSHWERFVPDDDLPALALRQRASDERLIAFCDALDAAGCARVVAMDRGQGRIQRDLAAHVLAHLAMHQTHHRGQVHAMLSGTAIAPPQLDEFLMPSEAHFRVADMAALGWTEREAFGAIAPSAD
jgi:uncharacterized damage-inducible protein DinB